jgi:hypothetical protein
MHFDSKKSRRELFQRISALGIFWSGVSRYAATPLIVALSPGHSDITSFRSRSLIGTGNHLDRPEKIPEFAQTTGTDDVFLAAFRHFRNRFAETFRMSITS